MKLSEETVCIATPGFAGFVPSLRYQFGETYGNATRHILHTDPTLKQGKVHQKRQTKYSVKASGEEKTAKSTNFSANVAKAAEDAYVWKLKNKYQTGDDRFSFPPVPGYTGFIPRSKNHFGQPYVEATNDSLHDFQKMLKSRGQLPPRVEKILAEKSSETKTASKSVRETTKPASSNKPTFCYSAAATKVDDTSPYKAPKGHPNQSFISGYTGFVPRLQKHFGEPYNESVRHAIEEFTSKEPYNSRKQASDKIIETRPIPGCTIFIPGSKYGYATTFGKTSEVAYNAFNSRVNGKIPKGALNSSVGETIKKDLKSPISGYRGHIPGKNC